jgi:ribonuclease P protein component
MMSQKFQKSERLCSKKAIERLFEKGSTETKTFYLFPFKVFYLFEDSAPTPPLPQVLFSISKRHFKRAVDRNLLRRRCREAYRKNKALLVKESKKSPTYAAFVFIGKEEVTYAQIEKSLRIILPKLLINSPLSGGL